MALVMRGLENSLFTVTTGESESSGGAQELLKPRGISVYPIRASCIMIDDDNDRAASREGMNSCDPLLGLTDATGNIP